MMSASPANVPTLSREAFLWRGSHPVLDFLNTEAMRGGERVDRLDRPEAVLAWLAHAGMAQRPGPDPAPGSGAPGSRQAAAGPGSGDRGGLLESARRLRSVLRRVVEALLPGGTGGEAAVADLNRILAGCPGHFQLEARDGGLARCFRPAVAEPLLPLLESALDLLCGPDRQRIRQCRSDTCILLFLDTSRNHSRHWCSMEACGNRAKVAAHGRRHRNG